MNGRQQFSYHRAVAPLMWVFVGLASTEIVVVHLLVAVLWNRTAAAILSVVTLASIAWLVAMIASMRRLPVTIDDTTLVMRVGTLRSVVVPVGDIRGLRSSWDAAALKAPGVAKLSLIAFPNVVVDLRMPIGRTTAIAHRLDDAAGFAAAIERVVRGHE